MLARYLLSSAGMVAVAVGTAATAQDALPEPDSEENVIVVTGTSLRGDQFQAVTPVEVFDEEEIKEAGFATVTDLVRNIPANYGSEANVASFTQNNTLGTAQVNLRGLGLGATLVLINNRRTTFSGTFANDGSQFVDINQIPLSLIQRAEVVKTGASAIYGSDAVAGVVNFVTRQDFQGVELDGQFQTTTEGSQEDITLNLLAGFGSDATRLTLAGTYFDRSELRFTDRDFTGQGTEIEIATAKPGSFVLLAPPANPAFAGTPVGRPVVDPACAAAGGNPIQTPGGGFCQVSTRDQFALVPSEERLALWADLRHDDPSGFGAFIEASYSDSEARVSGKPLSLPGAGASGAIIVSPANAFNPFGAPAVFVGRPLGTEAGTVEEGSDSETIRFAGGVSYEPDDGPLFALSAVHAENDFRIVFSDLLAQEFFLPGTTTVRNDFNVFGTSITDPALANDAALVDNITTQVPIDFESSITTAEASVTGTAFESASGPVGFATGVQYRVNRSSFDADDLLNTPGNLVFLFPIDDFEQQSIGAFSVFGETQVPIGPAIDVQAALRYENYSDGIGSSLDPQVAVTAEVAEGLLLRASAGTAFRAPTPLQTGGTTNQVAPIVNPCTGQRGAVSIVTRGNAGLDPEDSTSFSGGLAYRPRAGFRASIDFFHYDYDGVITRESPDALAAGAQCVAAAPGVLVPVADGLTVNPQTGQIAQIEVDFVNAGSIETNGLDLAFGYTLDTDGLGTFDFDLSGTVLTRFDVAETPGAPSVDRLGSRNVRSFARPAPQVRGNFGIGWSSGIHRVTAIARYTDSYRDDLNADARIDSLTTFDLQYAVTLDGLVGRNSQLRLGVINLTDEDPPFVFDRGGYDPLVADPRGRLVYVAVTQGF